MVECLTFNENVGGSNPSVRTRIKMVDIAHPEVEETQWNYGMHDFFESLWREKTGSKKWFNRVVFEIQEKHARRFSKWIRDRDYTGTKKGWSAKDCDLRFLSEIEKQLKSGNRGIGCSTGASIRKGGIK